MRTQRVTIARRISPEGKLVLEAPELAEFARIHPGRVVVLRAELLPIPPSEKSFAYYWKVVVPTVQRGFYETGENLTLEQTDRKIRELSPIAIEEKFENGKLKRRVRELDEMDASELNEMIEQFKEIAAESLDVYIEEPMYL